ncbi:MAG: TRAP transporter substrate-binding protein DctP [Rhodospirillaceae bacterium]
MSKSLAIVVAAASVAAALSAASAQTVKFTIISPSPPTVTPTTATKEFFVPEVNKRLAALNKGFKIEWNEAYGPNLAKTTEVLESVEEGIAHMGVLLRNFEESKLPLEQYPAFIPFGMDKPREMLKVDMKVRERVPQMDQMFDRYNQVALAKTVSSTSHMFTNFPVKSVDDVKGRKIGSSGAMGHVLRGTGAVIVTAAMTQSYVDIKNGVYEGYVIAETQAFPYRTFEVAQNFTKTSFGVTNVSSLVINKNAWNALPDFARQVLTEVAGEWRTAHIDIEERRIGEFTETMLKRGVKMTELTPDERRRWAMMLPNIAKEWAADMDKQGLPGSKILTAYMDEVRASGEPVVRNWDKE